MAQDGGVDPHNISVALGFQNRCQRRLTSSCIVVTPAGFEPGISGLRGRRPALLDEGTMLENECGTGLWIRTRDTRIRNPLLYPAELRAHMAE